ncbi:cytochrome P450 [Pseudooceanicola sp. 216_PA32_1]|uniref:Cytochrome P450 n=1 Tax=Pseudooceanicola pacificus TaxID=2676438 RepID=A0A844W221_9RHOB|nr:cytochrome P450 [Pseudooceanicola pacificus]MWB78186.1 cytochrome P450 [Pseudooceanicola pacificus]
MSQAVMESDRNQAPVLDIDPYDTEVLRSPYAFQERLREAGPIALIPKYDVYAVGRYEECATVLKDHEAFTAKGGIGIQDIRQPGDFRVPNRMLENDPPGHTEIRSVLNRYLSPIAIRKMKEKFEERAAVLADELVEKGEVDGVADIAETYILDVFPDAVGIDLPRPNILAIGEMRFNQSGPQNELYEQAMQKAQPYLDWFEHSCQREGVRPESIAHALFEAEDRGEFPEAGLASNMTRSLVGGGADSTMAGVGHSLCKLAENPGQYDLIHADPKKAGLAFEEALRLEPSFHVSYRTTYGEVELSGVKLRPDTKVGVYFGAANRDPRKFENPDDFIIERRSAGTHLGFGIGAHICIGQMIARAEAAAILGALARRVKRIELAGEPVYKPINQMRMLQNLPLRLVAA